MSTIAVIDYGMGNLRSASKALERVSGGARVVVTYDPEVILRSDRIVVPGVGAIRDCMAEVERLGLDDVIKEVSTTKPTLGICVGMQMLFDRSEENNGVGTLGIIPGEVKYFGNDLTHPKTDQRLKVPHMGWNTVRVNDHPLWHGIPDEGYFYFVHSYYAKPVDPDTFQVGTCDYGVRFCAAVAKDNLFGVQFHPEKSQVNGLKLLANFVNWDGQS